MKETFVDPATGWIVTRQSVVRSTGVELIDEAITDPQTGEVYQGGLRSPSILRDIGAWVRGIIAQRESNERRLKQASPEIAESKQELARKAPWEAYPSIQWR